jgi:hypothetical protein
MRVETLSTYILELPNGEELMLNESAWFAVQLLLKDARYKELLRASSRFKSMESPWAAEHLLRMAEEIK